MSKITQKIVSAVTCFMVVAWLIPSGAFGATADELQAQIDNLLAQLSQLQGQLDEGGASSINVPSACTGISFDRNLTIGSRGNDVKCLQSLLNEDTATQVATTGAGSPGHETTYFGPLTKAAVVKFQNLYASEILSPLGLSKGTGLVGPATRTKLNEMLTTGGEEETPPAEEEEEEIPPATGDFKAMLASDSPSAGTLGASSAYNTVLKAKIEAGANAQSITSVTVERYGLSVDTNIDGVLVVDEAGNRHGNVLTFASNVATIPFSDNPIKIAAGASATITIQVHMNSGATSGTMGIKLTAVSGTPTGLPLTGGLFTLTGTTNVLGSLTIDRTTVSTGSAVSVDIGQKDYYLSKFRFLAGAAEDAKIYKVILFENGTAADGDLMNFELLDPNGNVLATVEKAVNKIITFDLSANPYIISKGTQKDLSIRLDVVSGSSRTSQLVIQNNYDIVAKGSSTGLGLLATAGPTNDTSFPVGDGTNINTLTIAAGTLTLNKATASPSGTFGIGSSNVTLATWDLEAKGEDIQIQRADFAIFDTSDYDDFVGTVKLMTDGGQTIYSVAPASSGTGGDPFDDSIAGADSFTFASYYTIPAGTILKLKLVVDVATGITSGEAAQGRISDIYFKRMTSNTYGTASSATWVSGNTLSASAATLTATNNASYGATTIIAGQSDVLIGSYLVQTGSAEGVNISSLNIDINSTTGLSNMKLKRADTGVQIGTTASSPSTTNTFTVSGQLNIPASTTVEVDVYVNTATTASGSYTTDLDAGDISGVGITSGTTVTAPAAAVTGRTVTFSSSGSLTVSIETSGGASSQFYTPGLTGVEMARVKMAATVEDMKIQELDLRTLNGAGNIAKAKLLGTGLSTDPSTYLTAGTAVFTFSSGGEIIVPAYGSKVLTVVVDTTGVGTLVAGNYSVIGLATADAIGAGSGSVIQEQLTGTAYVAGTDAYSGDLGDVIYFTATADAGTITAAGFYIVTTDDDSVDLAAADLDLNGETTDTSWTAGDIITKLTKVESIAGNANAGTAYNVGDIVYLYDSDTATSGVYEGSFAIVTTAVASGSAISGLGFSPAGNIAISAAGDRVTKIAGANALVGNTMRYEEVEPVIALASSSPSGALSPSSDQIVAIYNVTASGYRDMTFDSLTLDKVGSNSPQQYVTKFSVWNGATKLAEVANTTVAGSTAATHTNADTILVFCNNTTSAAGQVGDLSDAEVATVAIGDKLTIADGTNTTTATVTNKAGTNGACGTSTLTVTFDGTVTIAASATVTIRNYRVHFDANQAQTGDTALAAQTITAGQTMVLTVKSDTSSVRTGVTSGTVTFGVFVPGVAGPLQVATTQTEGLDWDYAPLGSGAATYKTEGDSYPVNGNTLTY